MVDPIPLALAALVRDGRVLLVHRHPSRRWYPNCWDLAGGHIEPGESPHQAVERECLEELGVHIHNPQPFPLTTTDPTLKIHAFLVTHWQGEPTNTAPNEHDALRWFHPTELPALNLAHPTSLPTLLTAIHPQSPSPLKPLAAHDRAVPDVLRSPPTTSRDPSAPTPGNHPTNLPAP